MHRLIIALATGLWGGATMLAIDSRYPDLYMLLAATVGATIAGAVIAPIFRRATPFWSALAALAATCLGAMLAGLAVTLSDRFFGGLAGAVWGPMLVFNSIATSGPVCFVWLAGAITTHLIAKRLAQCRSGHAPTLPPIP